MQKSQVPDGGVNVGIKSLEKSIKTDRRKHSGEKSGWISWCKRWNEVIGGKCEVVKTMCREVPLSV